MKRVRRAQDAVAIVETIPRESIFLAQTPQGFRVDVLRDAIALGESGVEATDEAALAERAGHVVHIVEATAKNLKITTADDLAEARRRLSNEPIRIMAERVGTGYDLHRLVEGRPLVLGGVEIPCAARRARSFGRRRRVPRGDRRDPRRGVARRHRPATFRIRIRGGRMPRASTCCARRWRWCTRPASGSSTWTSSSSSSGRRLRRTSSRSARSSRGVLEILVERVSVKGKTNEGVDAVGRGEAIAAHAVALLASTLS